MIRHSETGNFVYRKPVPIFGVDTSLRVSGRYIGAQNMRRKVFARERIEAIIRKRAARGCLPRLRSLDCSLRGSEALVE